MSRLNRDIETYREKVEYDVWSEQCAEQARQEKIKRSECPYGGIDCAWCTEECEE